MANPTKKETAAEREARQAAQNSKNVANKQDKRTKLLTKICAILTEDQAKYKALPTAAKDLTGEQQDFGADFSAIIKEAKPFIETKGDVHSPKKIVDNKAFGEFKVSFNVYSDKYHKEADMTKELQEPVRRSFRENFVNAPVYLARPDGSALEKMMFSTMEELNEFASKFTMEEPAVLFARYEKVTRLRTFQNIAVLPLPKPFPGWTIRSNSETTFTICPKMFAANKDFSPEARALEAEHSIELGHGEFPFPCLVEPTIWQQQVELQGSGQLTADVEAIMAGGDGHILTKALIEKVVGEIKSLNTPKVNKAPMVSGDSFTRNLIYLFMELLPSVLEDHERITSTHIIEFPKQVPESMRVAGQLFVQDGTGIDGKTVIVAPDFKGSEKLKDVINNPNCLTLYLQMMTLLAQNAIEVGKKKPDAAHISMGSVALEHNFQVMATKELVSMGALLESDVITPEPAVEEKAPVKKDKKAA